MVFTQDHTFTSPLTTADVALGSSVSGREEWKTKDGTMLRELQEASAKKVNQYVASNGPHDGLVRSGKSQLSAVPGRRVQLAWPTAKAVEWDGIDRDRVLGGFQ